MRPEWRISRTTLLAAALAALALLLVGVRSRVGWGDPITDAHAWRQTQTALTAYYLVGQPLRSAYETPMMGPPWVVPMEFPVYQWLVARSSEWFGWSLISAGRLVSLLSFAAAAFPVGLIARRMTGSVAHALAAAALFLASSFYGFWGRSFMIEATALLLGLGFLAAFVRALDGSRFWAAVALVSGILAGLAKVTTFSLFLAAAGLFWIGRHGREWWGRARQLGPRQAFILGWRDLWLPLWVWGVPLATASAWVSISDRIKLGNPFSATLVSRATAAWNFGSWDQRLDPMTWRLMAGRVLAALGDRPTAVAVLGVAALAVAWTGRFRWSFAGCLGLFALGPLIFTNLYYVHDYYYCANLVFLLGAVWLGAASLLASPRAGVRVAGWIFVTACVGWQLRDYHLRYVPVLRANPDAENAAFLRMAERIKSATRPGDSVIWITDEKPAPVVAFYCERRTLILTPGPATAASRQVVESMARANVTALANSSNDRATEAWILRTLAGAGIRPLVLGPKPESSVR